MYNLNTALRRIPEPQFHPTVDVISHTSTISIGPLTDNLVAPNQKYMSKFFGECMVSGLNIDSASYFLAGLFQSR